MSPNVTEHLAYNHNYWKRKVFLKLRKKGFRKRFFQSDFFFEQVRADSKIPRKNLSEIVQCPKIKLENFLSRNGNLSPEELMVIASIVAAYQPKRILEIGTFDGNTTLQMALNAPEEAKIYTLDLPRGEVMTKEPVLDSDLQFISDEKKNQRKFESTEVAHKIEQHFGDSTKLDFSLFSKEGPLDLIFIDGGHSYECVKSDTENALKILSDKGIILWHDFTPSFGGVYRYLNELFENLSLIHIAGTNLVIGAKYDLFS